MVSNQRTINEPTVSRDELVRQRQMGDAVFVFAGRHTLVQQSRTKRAVDPPLATSAPVDDNEIRSKFRDLVFNVGNRRCGPHGKVSFPKEGTMKARSAVAISAGAIAIAVLAGCGNLTAGSASPETTATTTSSSSSSSSSSPAADDRTTRDNHRYTGPTGNSDGNTTTRRHRPAGTRNGHPGTIDGVLPQRSGTYVDR